MSVHLVILFLQKTVLAHSQQCLPEACMALSPTLRYSMATLAEFRGMSHFGLQYYLESRKVIAGKEEPPAAGPEATETGPTA